MTQEEPVKSFFVMVGHKECWAKIDFTKYQSEECIFGPTVKCHFCGSESYYWHKFVYSPEGVKKSRSAYVKQKQRELAEAEAQLKEVEE